MVERGTDAPGATRFAVDWMLGRLARWLRVLGHDVAWGPHLRRRTLLACARRDGRVLVTRDTRLLRERGLPPHVFVRSDAFRDQLRELAAAIPLGAAAGAVPFSRCLGCNRPLEEVARERVRARVPAHVWETAPRFRRCPGCERVYWPATHHAHMRRELAALGLPAEAGA
jgi:uncharacterized protein with PIN domain